MFGKASTLFWFVFITIGTSTLDAGVILSDNFTYPDGPLVEVSNGRWKTHSGTAGQVEVVSGQIKLSQKKSEDVSTLLPDGPIGITNATSLYVRFRVSFSMLPSGTNGAYFAHFKDGSATSGLRCRVFAATNLAAAGRFRLGVAVASSSATAYLPQDLMLKTTYVLVCRMNFSNNLATLWLNPRNESAPSVTANDSAAVKAVTAFAFRQSLASGSGMGELAADDVFISTSFPTPPLNAGPVIREQPTNQIAVAGSDVRFSVQASGTDPLEFQWLFNGVELPGADGPILLLERLRPEQAGTYQVVVRDSEGAVTSDPAELVVEPRGLTLDISLEEGAIVHLQWGATPDQPYSIWASDALETDFTPIADDLWFWDGAGSYTMAATDTPFRFYRVCTP